MLWGPICVKGYQCILKRLCEKGTQCVKGGPERGRDPVCVKGPIVLRMLDVWRSNLWKSLVYGRCHVYVERELSG